MFIFAQTLIEPDKHNYVFTTPTTNAAR